MTFQEKLNQSIEKNNSVLCVGLDTDIQKIPEFLAGKSEPVFEFNKAIIDATADLVCAFKPQVAFYSADRTEEQLIKTINYIKENYPDIPVILDAKRNDIGNTAQKYAIEVFEKYGVDAATINPYLGKDSCEPFLGYKDKGIIFLCRTSNSGAKDFQDLVVKYEDKEIPLYQVIALKITREWNHNNNCLLVVGATYPEELKIIRNLVGDDIVFLMPGIGAQGGDIEAAVKNAKNKDGKGIIINSSRGIIYASSGEDFAEAARKEAEKLRGEINKYR